MDKIELAVRRAADISGKWVDTNAVIEIVNTAIIESARVARNAPELSDDQGVAAAAAIIEHFRIQG